MNIEHSKRNLFWMMLLCVILVLLLLILLTSVAYAQTSEPDEPNAGPRIHTVSEGENLTTIAEQYDVNVAQLQLVNHLRNDDILNIDSQLVIPGGDNYPAVIIYTAQAGDSVQSVAVGFDVAVEDVLLANRTISREYVPAVGQSMVLKISEGGEEPEQLTGTPHIVREGETILELAARYNVPVSHLSYANELLYPVRLFPGQRLRIPSENPYITLPGEWTDIQIEPAVIRQGDTIRIYVENLLEGDPVGQFAGQDMHFAPYEDGYVALAGVDAFTEVGRYSIKLAGLGTRPWYPFEQEIIIADSNFPDQTITVPEELGDLLDPSIRSAEDSFLSTIYGNFTEEKKWDGLFQVPVTDTLVTAPYGGGRSYNEEPILIYHTGTDFSGDIGTSILAAADGTVVFNDNLELRGNTVIIDHGWGVMTAYYHLSESAVETGQEIEGGQQIGDGGSSGLSTGPHLHWDLRIMDVPVDGMVWTVKPFP